MFCCDIVIAMLEFAKKHKDKCTILGLFIVFYFIFFHNIGSYPLMDIDETRYVLMSRDMFHSGDYLTLYLNGEYFFEKPPLYFWIECLSFRLFGVINEFSARFPAALCAMLMSFLLYFTGKKIVSRSYGIITSLAFATCLEFTILSKYAILDIFLCTFVCFSVFSYFMTLFVEEKNKKYCWWLFYAFSGLAVMAKGIPGAAIPFGTAFFASLYTRTIKDALKPVNILPGALFFGIITIPWHIIMLKMHPNFYHEYIIKHHLQRFVNSKELGRKQPWYFFIITVIWGLVPWIASLFAVLAAKIKKLKAPSLKFPENNAEKLLALNITASVLIMLFFSASSTKLITYILPIYPFAAGIAGYIWTKYINENQYAKEIEISSYIFSIGCLICGFAAIFMKFYLPAGIYADIKSIQWFSIGAIMVTQIPALYFLLKKNKRALFGCYALFILILSAFGTPRFYALDYKFGQNDLMDFARYAKENRLKLYAMNMGRRFSLNYYGGEVIYLDNTDEVKLNPPKTERNAVFLVKIKDLDKGILATDRFEQLKQGRKYALLKRKEN